MSFYNTYSLGSATGLKDRLTEHASAAGHFVLLDSQGYNDPHGRYDWLAAGDAMQLITTGTKAFEALRRELKTGNWYFGRLGYDLKNHVEKLHSNNADFLQWPDAGFFLPKWVVTAQKGQMVLHLHRNAGLDPQSWEKRIAQVNCRPESQPVELKAEMTRGEYIRRAGGLLEHIQRGDIYEVNFCQEFRAANARLNPIEIYRKLLQRSSPPFSALMRFGEKWILSMSPERYLCKRGNRLVSQPIKGTAPRGKTADEDQLLISNLQNDPKERAENAMIVDLVRNDLSRVAERNSVIVSEFLGIYSFPTVHQMVSTVEAELRADKDLFDALEASFPMGSMTGAPKIRAMQLIEDFESHRRGVYSGAIGYVSPEGDADFSVVIRTILYDQFQEKVSVSAGSALTHQAQPVREWEECLWKVKAIREVLYSDIKRGT